jgi:hypothetical protein
VCAWLKRLHKRHVAIPRDLAMAAPEPVVWIGVAAAAAGAALLVWAASAAAQRR